MTYDYEKQCYWMGTRAYESNDPLKGDQDVDMAIVGGGFTGLSTAYHLKKLDPGLRIAILESQVIGYGASGRNAGFSQTRIGGAGIDYNILRFGYQKTLEAYHYTEKAVDYTRELIEKLEIDCDYEHPGNLNIATSGKNRKKLERELRLIEKVGVKGYEWVDKNALQKRVKSPLFQGGWYEKRGGILNPAKLAWGWKDVIEPLGVEVYENSPVESVKKVTGGYHLKTPKGSINARKVVLATNAWSHQFHKIKLKQAPMWVYNVVTEPLTAQQMESIGWLGRESIEHAREMIHYYRLTADNRLFFGGRDVSLSWGKKMDKDLNDEICAALKQDVVQVFPALKEIGFTHEWGGPVSATIDLFPALGYAEGKELLYSVGMIGHGVSMCQLNGKTLADLALERDTDLTRTFFVNRKTLPFLPEPLRTPALMGAAWYLRWTDRKNDVFKI